MKPLCSTYVAQANNALTGYSKGPSSEAADESKPEAYPLGYIEDFNELQAMLMDLFRILLVLMLDEWLNIH